MSFKSVSFCLFYNLLIFWLGILHMFINFVRRLLGCLNLWRIFYHVLFLVHFINYFEKINALTTRAEIFIRA